MIMWQCVLDIVWHAHPIVYYITMCHVIWTVNTEFYFYENFQILIRENLDPQKFSTVGTL